MRFDEKSIDTFTEFYFQQNIWTNISWKHHIYNLHAPLHCKLIWQNNFIATVRNKAGGFLFSIPSSSFFFLVKLKQTELNYDKLVHAMIGFFLFFNFSKYQIKAIHDILSSSIKKSWSDISLEGVGVSSQL